jgi:hypothetical protein
MLLVWITNHAGTVEEVCLGTIASGIVGVGGMRIGRGVEGGCGKGEIGLGRDGGGSGGGMMIDWSTTETGECD